MTPHNELKKAEGLDFPVTDERAAQFLKDYDAGKYPLSQADLDALARSRPKLMAALRKISQLSAKPNERGEA